MMMRWGFWIALLFAAAVALALFAERNLANVVVLYPPYRVEMSLNLALTGLLALCVALHLALRLLGYVMGMPARVAAYRERVRILRASAALRDALESLFAGRFGRAERFAREAQSWEAQRETAALIGARAAHRMQETERRDAWMAEVTAPGREQAKLISMAEWRIDAGDADGALEAIAQLQAQGARQIQAQRIALRAHQSLKNWSEVLRLAGALEKRQAIPSALADRLKQMACEALLAERRHDAEALGVFWRGLAAADRAAPRIVLQAAAYLTQAGHADEARRMIEDALKARWDGSLVRRYADCAAPGRALPLIQQAEKWLLQHPADADLFYTLGLLCFREQLWGKAQSHLESALKYARADAPGDLPARAHRALAQLYEQTDRPEAAQRHYRQSALLAIP